MIRFEIPYPPTKKGKATFCRRYGLNAYYAGKHWAKRKEDADVLHRMTLVALRGAGVGQKAVNGPVEIRFYWDDGLDCDNHAVLGKAVVDALTGCGILPDDNRKWVRKVSHEFWSGGKIAVEVDENGGKS